MQKKTKISVIKCGGSLLKNSQESNTLSKEIKYLINEKHCLPVLVHGGGTEISSLCRQAGITPVFKDGLRVTNHKVLKITQMALLGITNLELVKNLQRSGVRAIGLPGFTDGLLTACTLDFKTYGFVGKITGINHTLIEELTALILTPVIASLAIDNNGQILNVNADLAAAALATSLQADSLVLLSDIDGYYRSYPDKNSLVHHLGTQELEDILQRKDPSVSTGMIPKLTACLKAVQGGVKKALIVNGTRPKALINAVLQKDYIGTTVTFISDSAFS